MVTLYNHIDIEDECAFNSAVYIQSWPNTLKNDDKMTVWRKFCSGVLGVHFEGWARII